MCKLVSSESFLLRRCFLPTKKYFNPDQTPNSRVFKLREKDEGKLSVDIKELTTYEKAVVNQERFFLIEIQNKYVLEIDELKTVHDPLKDGTNDAHAFIIGFDINDDILPGLLARKSYEIKKN